LNRLPADRASPGLIADPASGQAQEDSADFIVITS